MCSLRRERPAITSLRRSSLTLWSKVEEEEASRSALRCLIGGATRWKERRERRRRRRGHCIGRARTLRPD